MGKKDERGERLTDEDLLTEVLSRLPVKYLLQCKAVSKTWYSLISSPNFIKSHYQQCVSVTTNHHRSIPLWGRRNIAGDDDNNNNEAATLIVRLFKNEDRDDFTEEDGSYSLFQLGGSDDYLANLKFPFSRGDYPFTPPSLLVGCVCGIVCVCVDPSAHINANHCRPTSHKPTDMYIWNPATRQSKLIPSHTLYDCDDTNKVALGFGYDPFDFDFKVVRVVSCTIFPEVYSTNRDAWRNIEAKLVDVPCKNKFDICLHGFLFATGFNGMMAFNLNKEVFICDIKLPITSNEGHVAQIADFRDSVCVIIYNNQYKEPSEKINLWTLDDEACLRGGGVKASWTLMLSIDIGAQVNFVHGLFNGAQVDFVHGLFNSVEFLLVVDGERFSYNLDKKVGRFICDYPFFDFDDVFKYTESQRMLLVAGSKLVNWSDDEDGSEESSVDLEDDYEDYNKESNVDSEDDNEESSTADSEDNEKSNNI